MKRSKRFKELSTRVDRNTVYDVDKAVSLMKEMAKAKFDETVEIALRLGVDPRHADQNIRGTLSLPNGTGKTVRILVLTKGPNVQAAEEAGADHVGLEDYIEKIQQGWLDVDVVVASPDVMSMVGKLGKILGTRGMMPNPKSGTVTPNIAEAVREIKAGKIDFRVDKTGIIHSGIGKISFDDVKLVENIRAFVNTVIKLKPSSAKGTYLKSISISSTMGPGIFLDTSQSTYSA